MDEYKDGEFAQAGEFPFPETIANVRLNPNKTSWALKARDVSSVIYFGLKIRRKIDLFIGMESLNALLGVLLRRLGVVDEVVYCCLDYMLRRLANPVMNGISRELDSASARRSNFVWNIHPEVEAARNKHNPGINAAPQLFVPVACPAPRYEEGDTPLSNDVVYLGSWYAPVGPDLLVRAFNRVVQAVPDSTLYIIGDGPLRRAIEGQVGKGLISGHVRVYGPLQDDEADRIISRARVAVAPYVVSGPDSQFTYAESSKGKLYLAYGVPIVVTKQTALGALVGERRAGLAVDCTVEEIGDAITSILTDEELHYELHRNAQNLAADLAPDKIFGEPIRLALGATR